MKRKTILLAALLLPLGLGAQNLNPEVQVTNEYQTRVEDASKMGSAMRIPDSLLRFDYHFDYSVFDSPYKGSYEFSPYAVSITPSTRTYDGRKFYLRAGAGYVMKPELDLVWTAVDGKKIAVNFFASGNGFWGRYLKITEKTLVADKSVRETGWDFSNVAGVDARVRLGDFLVRTELGYDGIFTGHDFFHNDVGHAPYALVSLSYGKFNQYNYSLAARYRYVSDRHDVWGREQDHDVRVDGAFYPFISDNVRTGLDLAFNYNTAFWGFELSPNVQFRTGKAFEMKLGLRTGYSDKYVISPDVRFTFHLVKDYLDMYLAAEGRNNMLSYWDFRKLYHFYSYSYAEPAPVREIADCVLGFTGRADFGLRYSLKGGYRFLENAPFMAVSASLDNETFVTQDAQMLHADLEFAWESERFDMDGAVRYVWMPQGVEDYVFMPADVTASLSAKYNWKKRIWAGISGAMSTARTAQVAGQTVQMPWYLDLGVSAEYKLNKRVGFWLKGSNLLNHEVRQGPFHCPYGPSVIAGITLSL